MKVFLLMASHVGHNQVCKIETVGKTVLPEWVENISQFLCEKFKN